MNNIEEIILDNGLRIYLYLDERRHSTLFQHVTLFGGLTKDFIIDDKEYHLVDGVGHILEHYVVECNNEGNFIKELGEHQMNTNASTHFNMTRFYFDTVYDVKFGIEKMLKGIYNVSFDKEKLEKLKNPIYQEIRGRSDNRFFHSNLMVMNNLFNNYSFRNISGSISDVESINVDLLKICYEAFYQPNNQIIFIAGNFNKKEVLDTINNFYNNLAITHHTVKLLKIDEDNKVSKKEDILYYPTPEEYVEINYKIYIGNYTPKELLDIDYYINNFLANYFGITSNLYKELVNDKIISYALNYHNTIINDYLIVSIGGYTTNSKVLKEKILKEVKEMNSFNEEFFLLEKKNVIMSLILRDDNIISMIMPFVDNVIDYNYPYMDNVEDLEKLTYNDYVSCIKKLDFSNYTIIFIKEKETN